MAFRSRKTAKQMKEAGSGDNGRGEGKQKRRIIRMVNPVTHKQEVVRVHGDEAYAREQASHYRDMGYTHVEYRG